MSTPEALGKVDWLDIRAVWPNEATSFTPWLLDNADVLGDTLGLEIQLEEAEHSVGGFSLDLIGRDLTHEARLIVENQIEQSDHGHLGQLLTYTAGTDAATIVWIARGFRDEHRVALDWLNEHTGEDIRFFDDRSYLRVAQIRSRSGSRSSRRSRRLGFKRRLDPESSEVCSRSPLATGRKT
ncbi:MAG: hypothetical protein HW413_1457 [Thermoleophilia bacterium]|nr:hypothetical protein [Thermoleophilia bacterium]